MKKKCKVCGEEKDANKEFYERRSVCKTCASKKINERSNERNKERKAFFGFSTH